MQYQGISGIIYSVEDDKIASGGEGTIHNIQNNDKQVAKIFKPDKRSSKREEKLCYMVKTKLSPEQLQQVTWPQDVIYDQSGFVGYVMPKLDRIEPLNSIYSSGTNNKYDLRYRILTAINLCYAIQTVHNMGQICGDLNPQNININLDANDRNNAFHVTLVDTDSYHFTSNDTTYRCEVGLGDYIAPELQNKMVNGLDLKSVPLPSYTKETDFFALAVHIFMLLMNGCHPFACAKDVNGTLVNTMEQMNASNVRDSVVAPQPIENIKDGFFPFYEKRDGITYPIYAPSLGSLPENLQRLFIRTFVNGYRDPSRRVSTQEWINALMQASSSIICCPIDHSHYYFEYNVKCPLCNVDEKIRNMFGSTETETITPSENADNSSNINTLSQPSKANNSGWIKAACYLFVILGGVILMAVTDGNATWPVEQDEVFSEEQYDTDSEKNQYNNYIQDANNYLSSSDYDNAIASCDNAIKLYTNGKSAYYLKAEALYGKKRFSDALNMLEKAENIDFSSDLYDDEDISYSSIYDLEEKIENAIEKKKKDEKEKKDNNNRLKYGNKIKKCIKKKQYDSAIKLIKKGYKKGYLENKEKIYIKNGKLVKKITKGKGFVYYVWKDYAYIGSFKNGKPSGNGMEVGVPKRTGYGGYYTINGKFKNGYPNGKCTVYYSKYDSSSSAKFIGTYKAGWENGSFTWIDKDFKGGHNDTYYFSSNMGTRKIIEMNKGNYVYAKAKSGWMYYCYDKGGLKGHSTEHHGKK